MPSDRANLENLARARQLHAEAPDAHEIAKLLASGRSFLTDAGRPGLGSGSRFSLAYNAAHSLALAALRSAGYRPATGPGHRRIVFQTLQFTVGASARLSLGLSQHHDRRNKIEYEATVPTEVETRDLVDLVAELQALVTKRTKG